MTPLTNFRHHPVDDFLGYLIIPLFTGTTIGFFSYFTGNVIESIVIPGLFVGIVLVKMVNVLHHSHIWFSFGWHLNHLLISSAHHQIHHSKTPKHFNKNLGAVFAIWDWMFGTLFNPSDSEKITTGVSETEQRDFDRVRDCYLLPVRKASNCLKLKGLKSFFTY